MADVVRRELSHADGTSPMWVGPGALERAAGALEPWVRGRRVFVVSSERVFELQGARLGKVLGSAGEVIRLMLPDGEAAKKLSEVERLAAAMADAGGKRDSRLVTLGGGSVGDTGGFVAGCFLRGIEYAQVPTTLLAQVDAAIGGKTGVNLPLAKNAVGLFWQPRFVIADTDLLETLPPGEVRQGLFEVVKAAILADPDLFDFLERHLDEVLEGRAEALVRAIRPAVEVKLKVVAEDEREGNRRRLLNLGHTLGHALEAVVGPGRLRHGDAVGHGMLFVVELATRAGRLAEADADRIRKVVRGLRPAPLPGLDVGEVLAVLDRDKKGSEAGLAWVLPTAVGAAEIIEPGDDATAPEVVESLLASFLTGSVE